MIVRPRISFGKIAHRVGAVTAEQLEEARKARDSEDGDLQEILLAQGSITQELADLVRAAFVAACAVCERCGRRTDTAEREENDWACRCGGTFVALEQTLEEDQVLDPALLRSEEGDISDVGEIPADV